MNLKELSINPMNAKLDLLKILNYFNTEIADRDKKKWAIDYILKYYPDWLSVLEKVPEFDYHTLGVLIYLKEDNVFLDDKELLFIEAELKRLYLEYQKTPVVSELPIEPVKKVSVKSLNDTILDATIAEFEGLLDLFVTQGIDPEFKVYLKANNVPSHVIKRVPEAFQERIEELKSVLEGTDEELRDAYDTLSRLKIRRYIKHLESISEICQEEKIVKKVERKIRVHREQPVAKIVSKVKWKKDDEELGLKSEYPSKLVNSQEVWLYSTRYKTLQVYKTVEPTKISVKGTTLIGWEPSLSFSKRVRKPEKLKSLTGLGKRDIMKFMKELSTKESEVTGRINDETIILKVF